MIELNRIYNEDCLEGMKRIPDNSDRLLTIMTLNRIGRTSRFRYWMKHQNGTDTRPQTPSIGFCIMGCN